MKNFFAILIAALVFVGCQVQPTKVYETKENHAKDKKGMIQSSTVILDARPPFLSAVARPNGSIPLQWEDFTQKEPPFEAYLENDLFFHARRLARLGIGPDTDVLIVGRGAAGEGEEGRLAWTLKRMGMKKVRFASLESLDWPSTKDEAPPRAEVPIWKPVVDESLEISRKDAVNSIQKPQGRIWVLDVRPGNDYLKDADPFAKLRIKAQVVNIPWTEFLNKDGGANPALKEHLAAVGILPGDVIYVIDEKGVRSAGSTLILRELGYNHATHWTGGYREVRWFLKGK